MSISYHRICRNGQIQQTTFDSIMTMKLTSNVVVVFGNPDNGGLIGEGEVPPVNKEATIAPP